MFTINPTIDLGTIFVVLGWICTAAFFVFRQDKRMDRLIHQHSDLKEDLTQMSAETQMELRKLSEVVILQGRHDERITAVQMTIAAQGKRLDDLTRRANTFLDMKMAEKFDFPEEPN